MFFQRAHEEVAHPGDGLRLPWLRARIRIAPEALAPHKAGMFQLGGTDFPNDNATLHAALEHGIAPLGAAPSAITLDGVFPSFTAIRIDLTGARFHRDHRPVVAPPDATGGFFARVVEIHSAPAFFESLPFHLSLRADDCVFAFGIAVDGTRAGMVRSSSGGSLEVSAGIADIEAALLALASEAASAHGASVQSIRVSATTESPRRLAITATATARAMMISATLTIRGRLDIDDAFNARLSDIACTGEGMIANLAAAQLRPRLSAWEGFSFPLARILPPGFALTDVLLDADSAHGLRASFRMKGVAPRDRGTSAE